MKGTLRTLIFAVCGLLPQLALADPAGTAKGVDPAAEAKHSNETRTLVVGSDIFLGDRVDTGDKGHVEILFADTTKLVVGPHSSLLIEDYLLRNDGSAGKLAVNMMSGAFRFVTGKSAKDRYELDTPTGTIGIRGTAFDVFVQKDETRIMLYHGQVRFCNRRRACEDLTTLCEVGEMTRGGVQSLGLTSGISGAARNLLRRQFPYAENQAPLAGAFRIGPAYGCLHAAALNVTVDSGTPNRGVVRVVPPPRPEPSGDPSSQPTDPSSEPPDPGTGTPDNPSSTPPDSVPPGDGSSDPGTSTPPGDTGGDTSNPDDSIPTEGSTGSSTLPDLPPRTGP